MADAPELTLPFFAIPGVVWRPNCSLGEPPTIHAAYPQREYGLDFKINNRGFFVPFFVFYIFCSLKVKKHHLIIQIEFELAQLLTAENFLTDDLPKRKPATKPPSRKREIASSLLD
ncbi:MAG: hypothetical protein ACXWTH_08985 [Methylosarcina sp.]